MCYCHRWGGGRQLLCWVPYKVLTSVTGQSIKSQSQSYITTDSQSASLSWSQAPIWDTRPIFLLLSLIIFRQLQICWCGAPSLTRSRVCSFQFLLVIASTALLRSESHGTHEHILLSLFLRLPHPGGPGSCIYFPQEQGSPVIPPGIGWVIHQSQSHVTTDGQSVSQSVSMSWCRVHSGTCDKILLSVWKLLYIHSVKIVI
jgi:hypothetical protein